ncbi:beta-1,3-galactosyltransferase 9 [Latimeria chalumnae]|uniref:Hexosyltransferase n=1 Tax=Latimeria chalumnae TaxID=7897 RepID=H3B481_LATCH|nr:PREDICTED: putative UDP-GlcNAc:betaGal beta-1,3-N-acetylglucosaminyltransferase LOC100288842 [Latimeria chalumnae]|eukprot:XP_005987483.1 PREDICTED: putative UDP-GlcNAc:betaGal beta-1,3-N-acetylglucosaminyltransferase LOC100288842 [Latimeria chalumnae]
MQWKFCRLRTHQWCFILFNVMLFHALLFGADFVEEYLLQSSPATYADAKALEIRETARKLDMTFLKANLSKFYLISNPHLCSGKDVFLLSVVFSNPENKTLRSAIRNTWANITDVNGYSIITIFALGSSESRSIQSDVIRESSSHGDIIQGIFVDSSSNLTLKTIMMMQWTVTFCPMARFVLKADEEMFVNYFSLVDYLLRLRRPPEDLYIGRVIHQEMPNRDPHVKDFVSVRQYQENYYPDYCSGSVFLISQDVARKIYVVSKELRVPVPPDVYVGICTKKAGVVPTHSFRFSGAKHIRYNRCCYKFIFSSSGMTEEELPLVWQEINDGRVCTILETYYGLVACKVFTYLDKFKFFNAEKMKAEDISIPD